jgi:hypothetical protein
MIPQADDAAARNDTADHPETDAAAGNHSVYTYETAGITERQGHIPLWLWLVVIALVIWSVYYLITYWQAPTGMQ